MSDTEKPKEPECTKELTEKTTPPPSLRLKTKCCIVSIRTRLEKNASEKKTYELSFFLEGFPKPSPSATPLPQESGHKFENHYQPSAPSQDTLEKD